MTIRQQKEREWSVRIRKKVMEIRKEIVKVAKKGKEIVDLTVGFLKYGLNGA